MGIGWDEVEQAAEDRRSWRNRVAQCVFDAGLTSNQEHRKQRNYVQPAGKHTHTHTHTHTEITHWLQLELSTSVNFGLWP